MAATPQTAGRSPFRVWQLIGFMLLGALIAHSATSTPAEPAQKPVTVRDARTCAALAVYSHSARSLDWGYLATVARTTLNQYTRSSAGPDCGKGLATALSAGFSPARWQHALDVVDAVHSGDYSVSPDACARAQRIVPLDLVGLSSPSDAAAAARAQCVTHGFAFVGGAS